MACASIAKSLAYCYTHVLPLAPQPVLQLRVKHANESSLSVMWVTPVAEWDSYVVSLGDRDLTVINKALVKEAKEYTFSDLVPGRKYTATITSISGDLSNWTSVEGRTGNTLSIHFESQLLLTSNNDL